MSDKVLELRPARPAVDVTGYVEAVTEAAALGWAWQPGRSTRVAVELRFGEKLLSSTIADVLREDLARSGIGDGAHAFSLPIPPEYRTRAHELSVVACLADGSLAPLSAPPAAKGEPDGMARLQRGIEMLIGSQRLMHRNLQTALTQQGPSLANSLAEINAAQGKLEESIVTLECFVVRIEQSLHGREASPATVPRSVFTWVSIGLSALALAGSCAALSRVLFG